MTVWVPIITMGLSAAATVIATVYALGRLKAQFDRVSESCEHLSERMDELGDTLNAVNGRVARIEGHIEANGTVRNKGVFS